MTHPGPVSNAKILDFARPTADPLGMEPIYLKSEDALYLYIKTFLKNKPKAIQLDGSDTLRANPKVVAVFTYSIDGKKYKLCGDLTRKAAEAFVKIADEHGSAGVALKEYSVTGYAGLILANTAKPDGFHCLRFVAKASSGLKKAA